MDVLYFPEVCDDVILWGMRDRDGTKHLSSVVISLFCFNALVLYKDMWSVEAGLQ